MLAKNTKSAAWSQGYAKRKVKKQQHKTKSSTAGEKRKEITRK
jgi:hypothetical protein